MRVCQICSENPDGYKGKNEFVCSRCTDARVNFVAMLENEFRKEILNFRKESQKGKEIREEPLGIIRDAKEYKFAYQLWKAKWEKKTNQIRYDGKDLKEARRNKGFSQDALAAYLGISKSYLCKMEKGQKQLSDNAIQFIKSGINFHDKSKKSLNTTSWTSK